MEAQSPMSTLFIFVIFGLIFYFMIYRPQITKVTEGAEIVIALNDTTEITINRNYIVSVLPKGSVKSL
ncbi:MAG: hypothetical protein E6Z67_04180 [Haemophilus parainfluenzae]|nr:hypothetical protein [Haemophilus parainfluenzae]